LIYIVSIAGHDLPVITQVPV